MTDQFLDMSGVDAGVGGFVKNLRGQTGTGFHEGTHVHKDWWARTLSHETVMEFAQRSVDEREDIMVDITAVRPSLNGDGEFVLCVPDGREFVPTDHALNQFSIKAGVQASTYLKKLRDGGDFLDGDLMVHIAQNSLRHLRAALADKEKTDRQWRLRTYTDGTCRAVVSDRYAPIDNRWYIDQIKSILPGSRWSHWRSDEDTIYGNVLMPDSIIDYGQSDDSDYGGMISASNCEIGRRKFAQTPSLFRSICMNGCIWGQKSGNSVSKRHVGQIDLESLAKSLRDNIEKQIRLIPDYMRVLLEAQNFKLGESDRLAKVVAAYADSYKLTPGQGQEVAEQWITHEAEHRNLFGLVNAVTRAGQNLDNDGWVSFDELGGRILTDAPKRWEGMLKRADSITDEEMQKLVAPSV